MSNTHEGTEEQVAAALADLLDQPHPTTDDLALQPYLDTFQQLQPLSENPADFFQKELAWLIIGQETQQPKRIYPLSTWLARIRAAFTFSWRPSPRLALGVAVLIIVSAWLFWPINPATYRLGENSLPLEVDQRLSYSYGLNAPSTSRFEMLVNGNWAFFSSDTTTPGGVAAAPPSTTETEPTTNDGFAMNQSQTRMVQQEATLSLIVDDVPAIVTQITDLAFAKGGYLTNLESGQTANGNPGATAQLRVPAEQFFSTLADIKELGLEVVSENITSEDVTSHYVDLNARLRNLQITETEIGELLATAQDRGESSQEILHIYDDLTAVREEIELLQGQIQYLEQTVAMSLISVSLVTKPEEIEAAVEELKPNPFNAGEIVKEAWVNLINIVQDIVTVLIWLVLHSPFVLLPLGLVWFIRHRNRTNQTN